MQLDFVTRPRLVLLALAGLLLLAGCRQDMHDQAVLEPFEESALFPAGLGSRPFPDGTIARGLLQEDAAYWAGVDALGRPVTELPVAVTSELLARGRERYDAFCSPCHDRSGDGRGMVVRRGFKQPASFHQDRLRQQPVGYYFNVISNGFGEMSSYAAQIGTRDRWAIVAYLRTMQWGRSVSVAALPSELAGRLEEQLAGSTGGGPGPERAGE